MPPRCGDKFHLHTLLQRRTQNKAKMLAFGISQACFLGTLVDLLHGLIREASEWHSAFGLLEMAQNGSQSEWDTLKNRRYLNMTENNTAKWGFFAGEISESGIHMLLMSIAKLLLICMSLAYICCNTPLLCDQ